MVTQGRGASRPRHRRAELHCKALTGIRFFAAIHVVLFHYAGEALAGAHWSILAIVACGPSAVSLFYVLSGIVLVYSCTRRQRCAVLEPKVVLAGAVRPYLPDLSPGASIDGPFFLSAMLKAHDGIGVALWGVPLGLLALLLLHAWTPLSVFAWNTPGWSVSAEAFFYSLFPSLSARLKSSPRGSFSGARSVFYWLALVPPLLVVAAELSGSSLLQVQVPAGCGRARPPHMDRPVRGIFADRPPARVPDRHLRRVLADDEPPGAVSASARQGSSSPLSRS